VYGRLQLNDADGPQVRAGSEQIDRPAIAVAAEGHLWQDVPVVFLEPERRCHAQPGVALVDEPVGLPASPVDVDRRPRVECGHHGTDGPERVLLEVTRLQT
jgi:hypothetical protein